MDFIPGGPCDVRFMDAKKNHMTKWNHRWTVHLNLVLSKSTETVSRSQDCHNKRMHMKGGNIPACRNCKITMPRSSTWTSYSDCCSHVRAHFRPLCVKSLMMCHILLAAVRQCPAPWTNWDDRRLCLLSQAFIPLLQNSDAVMKSQGRARKSGHTNRKPLFRAGFSPWMPV